MLQSHNKTPPSSRQRAQCSVVLKESPTLHLLRAVYINLTVFSLEILTSEMINEVITVGIYRLVLRPLLDPTFPLTARRIFLRII